MICPPREECGEGFSQQLGGGPGPPHRQAGLATGTLLWVLAKADSTRGLLRPPTGSLRSDGGGLQRGNDPILSSSPAPRLGSGAGQAVGGSNTKRGPGALSSAELHPPQPPLCCWRSSAPSSEPSLLLQLSAWPCLWCGFGICPSCMRLCVWLHPPGRGLLPPAALSSCVRVPGSGRARGQRARRL